MIRAVLCDFDGVIRLWPDGETALIERKFGLPDGAIAQAAFEPRLLHKATTGSIRDDEWRRRISEALVAAHGDAAVDAVAEWSRLKGVIDVEMRDLLREV